MAASKNKTASTSSTLSVLEHNGHRVLEIAFRGKRCWVLAHVEEALDYKPGALTALIRQEWRAEFRDGKHLDVIQGDDLRDLKSVLPVDPRLNLGSKTRRVTVLYQPGLDLVILKTHKPHGIELRALLVDHVIPQLRETGSATLPGAPPLTIDMDALAKAVAAQLSPQLSEMHRTMSASMLLDPKFRKATIQQKIQACVDVALRICPTPVVGRSKRPSKNPAKTYSTSFHNLVRGAVHFGVTGCRWDGAPLDTFMNAVGVLDGILSMLQKFGGGVGSNTQQQMPFSFGSN